MSGRERGTNPTRRTTSEKEKEAHYCLPVVSALPRKCNNARIARHHLFTGKGPLLHTQQVVPGAVTTNLGPDRLSRPRRRSNYPRTCLGDSGELPLQCPLPLVRDGDRVVPGQPAAQFVKNTNPSKLDDHGYCFFERSIPLDMLEKVEAEVDKIPIG